jgi:P4 family phage/plasmid primase-like protien
MNSPLTIQQQWYQDAEDLAKVAMRYYVGRVDAWGGHNPLGIRDDINPKTNRPFGKNHTVTQSHQRGNLTHGILLRHFRPTAAEDVIGTLAIDLDDTCKRVTLDLDAHKLDEDRPEIGERNQRFALHIRNELKQLGLFCLVTDSNGKGGYHVNVLFEPAIPSLTAYRLGEWLLRDWEQFGFKERPESFPKSATHKTQSDKHCGGGWARLPGRHHTRDIWATAYDGEQFVSGTAAVNLFLTTRGNNPDLIPGEAREYKTDRELKQIENQRRADEFARQYLDNPRPAVEGTVDPREIARGMCAMLSGWGPRPTGQSGRENNCYSLMCWIIRGTGLSPDEAVSIVAAEWNWKACTMDGDLRPFTDEELRKKARDAHAAVMASGGVTLDNLRSAEKWARGQSRCTVSTTIQQEIQRTEGFSATDSNTAPGKPVKVLYSIDDPCRLAVLFVGANLIENVCRYLRCNESWYLFAGTKWESISEEELRATVTRFVQSEVERDAAERLEIFNAGHEDNEKPPRAKPVRKNLISDVLSHITARTIIPSDTPIPCWLGAAPDGFDPRVIVPFSNGILNLKKLTDGQSGYLIASTPRYFCLNVLPYQFDVHAMPPLEWLKFMKDLWPNDDDSISCLQEWLGLLLVPDIRFGKILLIVGPRRSGKGTILRIIRALIGETNVAAPTLGSLSTNFGLWPLIGKLAALIGDARLSGQTDTSTIVERLLQISGEDGVTVDRKNQSAVTLTLPTRFVLATNELLRLPDASGALSGRQIVLQTKNSFYGQEDADLTDRLLKELPGILAWAICGWQRLMQTRRFTLPESSQELVRELEDVMSPVSAFVRECCDIGPFEIDTDELFNAWQKWCDSEHRVSAGNMAHFGVQLRAACSGISKKRSKALGVRLQKYVGIRLKCDSADISIDSSVVQALF